MLQNAEALVDQLRSMPDETEYLEFKHNFSDFEREGQDICALANSAAYHGVRYAYKVWGIEDATHEVLGTTFKPRSKKKGNQDLEIWLRTNLSDNANFEFAETSYQGLPIVILRIWPALHHPVRFQNAAYIRTNSSTQKVAAGSLRESELWRRIQHEIFEDQTALDNLDMAEVFELLDCARYFELLGLPQPSATSTMLHYIEQEGLVSTQDDGRVAITNLGAILFARDLSRFPGIRRKALRIIRYDGNGRASNRSEREFAQGYSLVLQSAYDYLDGMIAPVETISGIARVAHKRYPEVSLRELIVNALIHQDLTITGSGPMVEVFNDRIEVTNPGSLLVETERIVNDPPQSRNEKLTALMRRFGFCEEAGSGWDKIIEGCEELRLPAPRIEARSTVRITLFQSKDFRELAPAERLSACYWHTCLKYGEGGFATNASLRHRFGVKSSNAAQISRLIRQAVDQQLIKPVNPDTSPRYMQYVPGWA